MRSEQMVGEGGERPGEVEPGPHLGVGVLKGVWHGEGICEALRMPRVNGVETRGIKSREESHQAHQKLVPFLLP